MRSNNEIMKPICLPGTGFWRLGLVLWVMMLILTGTFIRTRSTFVKSVDWLVIARLIVFIAGLLVGGLLLARTPRGKQSQATLLGYVAAIGASVILASSHKLALGYWILLCGGVVLVSGMAAAAREYKDLMRLEAIWFWTVTILVAKDLFISTTGSQLPDDARLGTGITSPAAMATYALLVLFLSISRRPRIVIIAIRVLMLFIIYASWTRIVLIGFGLGMLLRYMLKLGPGFKRRLQLSILLGIVAPVLMLSAALDLPVVGWALSKFHRGQDESAISSLAGRKEIWGTAITILKKSPKAILFGHGYGLSQFHLNWRPESPEFYASHCHNAFLEHLFASGLVGLFGFLVIVRKSVKWIADYDSISTFVPAEFALRGACVTIVILAQTWTEITIGGRPDPASLLFYFYLASLGRISNSKETQCEPDNRRG